MSCACHCLVPPGHSLPYHSCVGLDHVPATGSEFSFFPHLLHETEACSPNLPLTSAELHHSLNSAVVYHTVDWPPRIALLPSQIGPFSSSCFQLSCGFPHRLQLCPRLRSRPRPSLSSPKVPPCETAGPIKINYNK